jgi:hypothetical protein
MATTIHGSQVEETLPRMPCGGTPQFDHGSGYSYRCSDCFAVIGSIGQPRECVEMNREQSCKS